MPNYTSLNLGQLRLMTRAEILTAIAQGIAAMCPTKRSLIAWLLDVEVIEDAAERAFGPDGQVAREVTVRRDVESGVVVSKKRILYTYYPPEFGRTQGPVDEMVMDELDVADNLVQRRCIKHFLDGRQPRATVTTGEV